MTFELKYQNAQVVFKQLGIGHSVVLLHGYLESMEIWDSFAKKLSNYFKVILVDLPGHGLSTLPICPLSVDLMADMINQVLDKLHIKDTVIIGHSMGAYVALAFCEYYLEKIKGVGLFHSVPWADSAEKRQNRLREIELIKQGKKNVICNYSIANSFNSHNKIKFRKEIQRAKNIALSTSNEGIIAILNALMMRKDRTELLRKINIPVFFGLGKDDYYIPLDKILKVTEFPARKQVSIFKNSGHMAFIEEESFAIDEVKKFLTICYSN